MDTCPNCHRKLISHASAKCNWCGAIIQDNTYQASAAANRDAYFAEEAAHDAASLTSASNAFNPAQGASGYFTGRRNPLGFLQGLRRRNAAAALPVAFDPNNPYGVPTAPPKPYALGKPAANGAGSYPRPDATVQPLRPPSTCPNQQVRQYGAPVGPAFGTDVSTAGYTQPVQRLADQPPIYPPGKGPTPEPEQAQPEPDQVAGRFGRLEL